MRQHRIITAKGGPKKQPRIQWRAVNAGVPKPGLRRQQDRARLG
jgi:hypothetical protein